MKNIKINIKISNNTSKNCKPAIFYTHTHTPVFLIDEKNLNKIKGEKFQYGNSRLFVLHQSGGCRGKPLKIANS